MVHPRWEAGSSKCDTEQQQPLKDAEGKKKTALSATHTKGASRIGSQAPSTDTWPSSSDASITMLVPRALVKGHCRCYGSEIKTVTVSWQPQLHEKKKKKTRLLFCRPPKEARSLFLGRGLEVETPLE